MTRGYLETESDQNHPTELNLTTSGNFPQIKAKNRARIIYFRFHPLKALFSPLLFSMD